MSSEPATQAPALDAPGAGRTVLLLLHGESVGGASLSALRLIPLLERRGWRFVVWAPRPSPLFDELRERGLDAHGEPRGIAGYSLAALRVPPGVRRRLGRVPRYFGSLWRLLREVRPSVVHANSLYAFAEGALARASGAPTVLHVHEMVRENRKGHIARRLAHAVHTEVVGVSGACTAALSTPSQESRIVHEAAPVPAEAPPRPRPGAADGPTVVGTIGVIARRKGTDLFVAAAERVLAAADDVELQIVGSADDPLDAEWATDVLARAGRLGIEHRLRVDVERELAGWDVFVLPSRIDPFPIVVLEAMASGLPVIGTDVDGLSEQITPETGLLVPGEDAGALAEAILALHRDRERRLELGRAGRERVLANFTLSHQAEGIERAYLAALGEGADR